MARGGDLFVFALVSLIALALAGGCSSSTVVAGSAGSGGAGGSGAAGAAGSTAGACSAELLELGGSPLSVTAKGDLYNYPKRAAGSCVSEQIDKQTAIYLFVAPKAGVVTLDAQGLTLDAAVYIRENCDDPFSELGCWEKGQGNATVEAGKQYFVFVTTGWKVNSSELYTLTITYN